VTEKSEAIAMCKEKLNIQNRKEYSEKGGMRRRGTTGR
jgi:hypothetical protein